MEQSERVREASQGTGAQRACAGSRAELPGRGGVIAPLAAVFRPEPRGRQWTQSPQFGATAVNSMVAEMGRGQRRL